MKILDNVLKFHHNFLEICKRCLEYESSLDDFLRWDNENTSDSCQTRTTHSFL